jgi:hypothetical protein
MKTAGLLLLALGAAPAALSAQAVSAQTFGGLRFRNIGPATMSGRVVDLAVHEANPSTFYVATATGGVWKTTNNGVTYVPVFQREATVSVGAIAVSQTDTNQVWVGTGERANRQSNSWGDGVYKSTNGGRSWRNTGLADSKMIGRIAIHPSNPNVVFVAAAGHLWGPNAERGLYRTADGGRTWQRCCSWIRSPASLTSRSIPPIPTRCMPRPTSGCARRTASTAAARAARSGSPPTAARPGAS